MEGFGSTTKAYKQKHTKEKLTSFMKKDSKSHESFIQRCFQSVVLTPTTTHFTPPESHILGV